jgi:antitoxin (DNA-binding transcriptional repressor) of toxin-antitoxin stability system
MVKDRRRLSIGLGALMPSNLTAYRVFIASPGGLDDVREAFRRVIQEYNEQDAIERRVVFIPVGWEFTLAGAGRPQQTINEDVRKCDYFFMLLWDRWGSPTAAGGGEYSSGAEEEFSVAQECYEQRSMRQIVVMFKDVDPARVADPGESLLNVLNFRKRLESEKQFLFETFDEVGKFEGKLRRHLSKWVRDHEVGDQGGSEITQATGPVAPLTPPVPIEAPAEASEESLSETVRGAERLASEGQITAAEQAFAKVLPAGDLDTLNRFGGLLVEKGSLASALDTFARLRELAHERGEEEWEVAALNNLGNVYVAEGELERAAASYQSALEIRERTLGPSHADVAASLNNLAEVYVALRRLDKAEVLFRRALEIQGVSI